MLRFCLITIMAIFISTANSQTVGTESTRILKQPMFLIAKGGTLNNWDIRNELYLPSIQNSEFIDDTRLSKEKREEIIVAADKFFHENSAYCKTEEDGFTIYKGSCLIDASTIGQGRATLAQLPKGAIIAWSPISNNVQVPTGFAICDGTNNTPNLKDRFILGTNDRSRVKTYGGVSSHMHNKSLTDKANSTIRVRRKRRNGEEASAGNHVHQHQTIEANHLPPHCVLIYLMKQ